jgi:hypothetical protein
VDWASVILAGLAGALSVAIAHLLVRNPKKRQITYALVLVLSFAILNALSRVFVLPHIHGWQTEEAIERQLGQIPAYREVRKGDPQAYERIRAIVRDGIREAQRSEIVAGRIRAVLSELVVKYIPYASDDAVVDFARVMVREIEELTRVDPNFCYRFLFPEQYGPLDASKHIDPKTLQNDLAALAILIRTATHNPQPGPDVSRSEALLKTVYIRVNEEYGDDVRLLDNPHGQSVDKEKVCTIIAGLYKHVLNMPKKQSGMVLRYMFASQ